MTDITAVGELLIDFTEAGLEESGRRLFEQNPGGAPANLLTLAARSAFILHLPARLAAICTVST